jgi:peptide/nickel transport system substrate-binding protein
VSTGQILGRAALGLLIAVLLGACRSEARKQGLVVLIESSPDSLDNRLALTAAGQRIAQLIAPGLVTFNDRSEPEPDLAREFRVLDAKTLEVTLRPRLSFHDGTPLTAEDVQATFEGVVDPAFRSPKADKFEAIAHIEVVDPSTVRFHLKRPYAPILAELSLSIVPRARARLPAAQLQDRSPIGAGPFQFASQPDEDHFELLPFEGYYLGKPRISKLTIRIIRDQTTRVLELLKGRADLAVGSVSPPVFPSLASNPHLQVLERPGGAYTYLGINVRGGPLADRRVRRALCHAIDTRPIIESKFHTLAQPATGMLPSWHWAYAPTPGCHRDLKLAARLLAEAGYAVPAALLGSTPELVRAEPQLHLTLKTSSDRFRKSIALVFKQQLAEVGVDLELRALEFGTFFNDVRKGNFELFSLNWSSVVEPDLMRWVFASAYIPGPENNFVGLNRTGYSNPELDALLERASRVGPSERKQLYARAQAILAADLPYLPLWHESYPAVVSSRLQEFEPSVHGYLQPLARARELSD